jgi:hypothetical protein
MIKLTSLLNELTFRNQAAFDKYSSTHKMRDTTKVTIDGKKTTVGAAEKKGNSSNKNKINIFDKPTSSDNKVDTKKDSKKSKKSDSTRKTGWKREAGAPYAEDDKFWNDRFLPGDKVAGDIASEEDFNMYRTAKIGISLIDWFGAKDKKDFNYDFDSKDGNILISSEDGPVNFVMFSDDKDGSFNFGFTDNEDGEFIYENPNSTSSRDNGTFGGSNHFDDPQYVYQSMRYIMAQPETIQLLRGEITTREYQPMYEKFKKELELSKSSKTTNEISLKSIVKEITDDALLDKTIRYKDSMGRDKEIKMKTALSKTYQTAKEPGMQNAYRTAKAMWDKARGTTDKVSNTGSHARPKTDADFLQAISGKPNPNKKPNRGALVQKPEPQKISGNDLKTSAEKKKDKNIGMKGGPGSGRTAADLPMLRDLMPNANFDRKPLSAVSSIERQQISTIIDKLAELGKQAKEKGEKAPNFNLCQVSVPGTNLYCDGNKGIERADMPQFKGTPQPGSPADKLPKDENGEADTEEFFKEMLNKQGIKVSEPTQVAPDRLKATQSELVGVKVAGMSKVLDDPNHPAYDKITAPIYVSNDGYVLDGHHRWAAIVAHNAANPKNQIPMNVRVIDEPIEPLVKRSNSFAEQMGIRAKAADTGAAGGPSPITK